MTGIKIDDHDMGLQHDLARMAELQQRRRALGLMLGGASALIAGWGGTASGNAITDNAKSAARGACIAGPEETAGPYPANGSNTVNGASSNVLTHSGIVRSDIRSSVGISTGTAPGVPLLLSLKLVNTKQGCAALAGYAVYVWHCTRDGNYSLYSSSLHNENYLRGVQLSNSSGLVTFQTIVPGCYPGRYPHIHFEVYPSLAMATRYTNKILTSQIALPRDVCSTVYNGATGYSRSVSNLANISIARDSVFNDNSAAQIAAMTPALSGSVATGYTGSITIGVPG